ncbi:MAG: radical SAM protein [Candidatus Bipolaricaulota bacterium]|nr:radical SAM protein [Candidatus Bipolaricaulota bacterium]MDW8030710.1 radical SAM protein [Candidatus Bipolaricaulota bacterium]
MRYKASKYNYNAPLGENEYVWMNGVSGSAFKANREVHAQVQAILADPNNCVSEQERPLHDQLVSLGFLVEENFDEIGFLKLRSRIARYGNEGLGLGIMLTLNCNFACPYCYQWRVNKWMNDETRQGLIKYVGKMMEHKRKLVIEWFGGEPLLDISGIKKLSEQFVQICKERGAQYEAGITTNGYLLTEPTARELARLGVRKAQITIDGPPDIHDKRRVLRDGRPTFDVILRNLEGAVKYIPSVGIRVNLDKTNSDRFPELLTYLAPLKERLFIGIASVVPVRAAQEYKEFCFLDCDFLRTRCNLEQLLKNEGFLSLRGTITD